MASGHIYAPAMKRRRTKLFLLARRRATIGAVRKPMERLMANSDWFEHRIIGSAAMFSGDRVALGLTLDDGTTIVGLVDKRVIADIRRQLDACEARLASPNQSAE
jgi:hypothetical protein